MKNMFVYTPYFLHALTSSLVIRILFFTFLVLTPPILIVTKSILIYFARICPFIKSLTIMS